VPSYYVDTCALKWRYLSGGPTLTVNQLMDDPDTTVLTSELTLLEWSSALGCVYRENQIDYQTFKSNELALMSDIANDSLIVCPMTRSIERARYLIEYVGIINRRALRTGDSIQLVTALEVASAAREVVTFVTCDRKLANIIQDLDTFQPLLAALFLSP
jgi:predicted nucleic acid-binding protein